MATKTAPAKKAPAKKAPAKRPAAKKTATTSPDLYRFVHLKGGNGEPGVETPCGLRATVGKSLHTNPDVAKVNCPACMASTPVELVELPLTALLKHPKNPRHRVAVDVDMVASIRSLGILEPLLAVPHPDQPGKYFLIAGHRREAGARKARLKKVPVLVRHDLVTEAQHVEVMLVENLHRDGLTPIEEAEGYATLEAAGMKLPAIAEKVGRDVKTVRARLKLLKLSASTRKRVHAGQLNLSDAAAMVEFADDPATTQRLEQAAKSSDGWSFKQALNDARRRRDAARDVAARTAKLLDAGATQLEVPDDESGYAFAMNGGRSPLDRTHSTDWGQHEKCLAFAVTEDPYYGPKLHEICTDPDSHREQLDDEIRERREAQEAEDRARKERTIARAAASDNRVDTLAQLAQGITVADVLGDYARALLPIALRDLSDVALQAYQTAFGVPAADRWSHLGYQAAKPIELTRFNDHVSDITGGGNSIAARALTAYLIAQGERAAAQGWYVHQSEQALGYFALLQEAGHAFSPIDDEQRDGHAQKVADGTQRKAS